MDKRRSDATTTASSSESAITLEYIMPLPINSRCRTFVRSRGLNLSAETILSAAGNISTRCGNSSRYPLHVTLPFYIITGFLSIYITKSLVVVYYIIISVYRPQLWHIPTLVYRVFFISSPH